MDINTVNFTIKISKLTASEAFNQMANFKTIVFIAFLSVMSTTIQPAMGQVTRSVLDFWLTFGELLATDFVNVITSIQLIPDKIVIPALPSFPHIPSKPATLPPMPAPNTPEFAAYINFLSQLYQRYPSPACKS